MLVDAGASTRRQAVVNAKDLDDSDSDGVQMLSCDVFVAPVHSIEIHTVVEELAVNASEQISILGKDVFDNTFSTLEVGRG